MEEKGRQAKTVRVPRTQRAGWEKRDGGQLEMQRQKGRSKPTGSMDSKVRMTSRSIKDWVSSVS